jgi:hypothetical protein
VSRISWNDDIQIGNTRHRVTVRELLELGLSTINVQAYGAKGDGVTDDTAAIQAAISAAAAGTQKVVLIPDGNYSVWETLVVSAGVQLMLSKGAALKPRADEHVVQLKSAAGISGGTIDVSGIAFTKGAIYLDGADQIGPSFYPTRIENINLESALSGGHGQGYGIYLRSKQTAAKNCYIFGLQASRLHINNFLRGIVLETVQTAGVSKYAVNNGNNFSDIHLCACDYGLWVGFVGAGYDVNLDNSGNIFTNIQVQATPNSERALYSNVNNNRYSQFFVWDWQVAHGSHAVELTGNTVANYIRTNAPPWHLDDRGKNAVETTSESYRKQTILVPPSVELAPSGCGFADDWLAWAYKRFTVAQTQGAAPSDGELSYLFRDTASFCFWNDDDPAIVIEIDFGSNIDLISAAGLNFYSNNTARNVKIELYNSVSGSWVTLLNLTDNDAVSVVGNVFAHEDRTQLLADIRKIRYTLSGIVRGGIIGLSRLWLYRAGTAGQMFVSRGGGLIYGNLQFAEPDRGPIIKSSNGTAYQIFVTDEGQVVAYPV